MVLLDRGRGRPADPDSVASHNGVGLLAVVIQKDGLHRPAVLRAQHEDMAHLDPAMGRERTVAARAGIPIGLFHIGRIVAGMAGHEAVLARLCQHHEFLGKNPADHAALGLDRFEGQSAPLKNPVVGPAHRVVAGLGAFLVAVKAVSVLHQEFPPPHQAETGSDLIPKLGLNLIEDLGQLTVRFNLGADEVRDDLLVRGAEAELPLAAVLEPQQLFSILAPPAGLIPQLGRLDHRHQQFLRAGAVHLFADDILDLADHAEAQRKVGVDAGRDLADHPGADHQPVADDLGLARLLAQCGY